MSSNRFYSVPLFGEDDDFIVKSSDLENSNVAISKSNEQHKHKCKKPNDYPVSNSLFSEFDNKVDTKLKNEPLYTPPLFDDSDVLCSSERTAGLESFCVSEESSKGAAGSTECGLVAETTINSEDNVIISPYEKQITGNYVKKPHQHINKKPQIKEFGYNKNVNSSEYIDMKEKAFQVLSTPDLDFRTVEKDYPEIYNWLSDIFPVVFRDIRHEEMYIQMSVFYKLLLKYSIQVHKDELFVNIVNDLCLCMDKSEMNDEFVMFVLENTRYFKSLEKQCRSVYKYVMHKYPYPDDFDFSISISARAYYCMFKNKMTGYPKSLVSDKYVEFD